MTRFWIILAMLLTLLATPAWSAEPTVTLGIQRLAGESDEDYWDRLFVQCASWTAAYGDISQPAKEKLMELGVPPLYHLVPTWLGDGDVRHRVTLEEIIVKVGPDAAPTLLPYVADPNNALRQRCIYVLGDFDRPEVLPALRPLLVTETDMLVLPSLIEAVGKRGAEVEGLAGELAPFTQHQDERIRRASAVALGRVGLSDAQSALGPLLQDRFFSVRNPARDAIIKLSASGQYVLSLEVDSPMLAHALAAELWVVNLVQHGVGDGGGDFSSSLWARVDQADPIVEIGYLRGVLSGWKLDHVRGDVLFDSLPERFDDPRVEAVRLMILAERDRILAQEARDAATAATS